MRIISKGTASLVAASGAVRKRALVISVGLISAYLLSSVSLFVYAQVCSPTLSANIAWLAGEQRDSRGIVHVSVNYAGGEEGGPSTDMRTAMENAITEWNLYQCSTGVVFETSAGGTADLEFVFTSSDSTAGGCARYAETSFRIYYGPSMVNRLTQLGVSQTAGVFKHELGHFLGLGHTSNTTIMSPGSSCLSFITSSVTLADAQKAGSCMNAGVPCPTPTPTPTPTPGTCNASPDWGTYPTTGCASGFVYNGSTCDRSSAFKTQCFRFGDYEFESCTCSGGCGVDGSCSPVLIDLAGDGFSLTDAAGGVDFDLGGDGVRERRAWTTPNSDDAWLAVDRNGNGTIDGGKELFGTAAPQSPPPDGEERNGFLALGEYDKAENGGNGDGVIDSRDAVYGRLRLWLDSNHNGVSEPEELHGLPQFGLAVLELKYRTSKRTDEHGNQFRYRAKVSDGHGGQAGRWAWDVYLLGAAQ
jgi:hypothetical protein